MSLRRVAPVEWQTLGGIVLIAVALRFAALGADLPWELERSNAPLQDAFWYLEPAAGPVDGSTPERMPSYDLPVWSHVARTWFRVFGTSLASAHALSAAAGLLALLLFWRVVRAGLGPRVALAAAAILAVHYPAVGASRTTLIYGPALVPLLLAAALWLAGRDQPGPRRAALTAGAWLLLLWATAVARPPLGALAGGLVLAQAVRTPRLRKPLLAACVLGLAGLVVAFLDVRLILEPLAALERQGGWVAETARRFSRYLPRQLDLPEVLARTLEWGAEPGVGQLRDGREWVVARGSGYFRLTPAVFTLAGIGLAAAWARRPARPAARETLALFAGWAGAFVAGAILLEHRPLRYFALLNPALALFAAYAGAQLLALRRPLTGSTLRGVPLAAAALAGGLVLPPLADWAGLVPGRAALWAAAQAALSAPNDPNLQAAVDAAQLGRDRALLLTAALGLGAGPLAVWTAGAVTRRVPPRALGAALLALATLPGFVRSLSAVTRVSATMREANALTPRLVGPDAKLIGPAASFLCFGHPRARIRGGWLYVGDRYFDRTLRWLRERSVTHIALDLQQARSAGLSERFARRGQPLHLVALIPVARPGARAVSSILLYRLDDATGRGYTLSPFERRRLADARDEGPVQEDDPRLRWLRAHTLEAEGKAARARQLAR